MKKAVSVMLSVIMMLEVGWPPVKQSAVVTHGSEAQILRDLNAFAIAVYDERPDIYNVVVGRFMQEYVPARSYHYQSGMFHQGTNYGLYRGQWDYNATWLFDAIGQPSIFGDEQKDTAYWYLYARRPDGFFLKDGDYGNNGTEVGAFNTASGRIMMMMGNYYDDPYLKYEMMRCKLKLNSFSYGHGLTSPVEFLCMNDPNLDGRPLSELPLTRYFGSPEGKEAWFNGKNHPVGTPIDMTKSHETDG